MSQIQTLLAPLSRLLFANRNLTIALLCLALGWVASYALINYWRNQRLLRELAQAKSDLSTSPAGRRYASAPAAPPEPVAEGGALPPIKGGRTYARNLGSALQKAGMTAPPAPQIYSPPVHQNWPPTPNPGQPGPGMPPQAPSYAPQPAPWGAPPSPGPSPWGYPAGANRSPIPGPPAPMPPLYQPQPPQSPGFYGPPPGAPFGQPPFPGPSGIAPVQPNAPSQPAPEAAPIASSGMPTLSPAPQPAPPIPAPPASEAAAEPAQESGRRGKPKRRRFNLSVLDNLEKIVQAKAAEVTRSATPAAAPPPAATTPPTPPVAAAPVEPALAPAAPPPAEGQPAVAAATQADALPLPFESPAVEQPSAGQTVEDRSVAEAAPEAVVEEEAPAEPAMAASEPTPEPEPEPASEPEAPEELQVQPEPEATPEPAAEPEPQWRTSMRTMMFGEEAARAAESAMDDRHESAPAESPRSGGEWTWNAMSPQREVPATEDEAPPVVSEPEPVVAVAAAVEAESNAEVEPVAEAEPPSSPVSEWVDQAPSSLEPEPAYQDNAEPPETAPAGKPSAGTLVIIEDDHTAADYYSTLFKGNGYQVEVANDGVSGVDLCVRVQPQVILLDVMMPRQNGILVLQTLRASDETKNTPVVVMSNFSEPTLIKRALQLGALEYVIKTQVEGPALLQALPRWMNHEKAFAAA